MFGFGKKKPVEDSQLYQPTNGKAVELSTVSDPVFAQKMMGEGFAVTPDYSGDVVSPIAGTITVMQGHAVGLKRVDGLEFIVHIGIDTVMLKGAPFVPLVKVGDVVNGGDTLVAVDWQKITEKKLDPTVMVLITNSKDALGNMQVDYGNAQAGAVVGKAEAK